MKLSLKIVLPFIFLTTFFVFVNKSYSQNGLKQDTVPKSQLICPQIHSRILKTNPLSMLQGQIILTGEYKLVYEFTTGQHQSLQIGGAYIGKNLLVLLGDTSYGISTNALGINGYRFQAAYKLFITKKYNAPVGIYVGPFASYTSVTMSYKQTSSNTDYVYLNYFNINAMIGGQIVTGKFAIDGYLGFGYKYNTLTDNVTNRNYQMFAKDQFLFIDSHFKFLLGLNLGMAL